METNEDSRQSRIPINDLDWKLQMFVKVVRKKPRKYQTEMALNLSLS